MSGSGVVIGASKLGVACIAVFIVVIVVRRTSAWSSVSESWAMHKCPGIVQDDLDMLLDGKDPKVRSCVGPATRAVCHVETIEWYAPCGTTPRLPNIVARVPLGPWDCTTRHVPDGHVGWVMKAIYDAERPLKPFESQLLAAATDAEKRMFDDFGRVASLLKARQAVLDAQVDVPRP